MTKENNPLEIILKKLLGTEYELFKNKFTHCDSDKFGDLCERADDKDLEHFTYYYIAHSQDIQDMEDDDELCFEDWSCQQHPYLEITKEQYDYLERLKGEENE